MFYPIKGGSKIIVGEGYECHLPQVPPRELILFYNLPKEEQYWRRQPLPDFYMDRAIEEEYACSKEFEMVLSGKKKTVTHVDPILERYRRQEWHRRTWGVWFMNDGIPTYITGHHYWYLNYCKADHKENGGYPYYYEFSRDNFYIRQWCEENPRSLGYMMIGSRATGKSAEEVACITNNATRLHNHRVAVQGKHYEDDSKKIMIQSKIVPLFNSLPTFFKPQFGHGTNPQAELLFSRPSVKGKEGKKITFGPDMELLSTIFAAMPGVKALDGETLGEIFESEIGKCENPENELLLFNGRVKKVKEISMSDKLMGPDSKPRTILEIKRGQDVAFKIIPKKQGWDSWVCSSGHKMAFKWSSESRPLKFNGREYQKDETVIMTIDSYLKLCKTHRRHLLLFKVPIDYRDAPVFIDPYLMGLWLGDGDKFRMVITNEDQEVASWLQENYRTREFETNGKSDRYFVDVTRTNPFLRYYRVSRDKHIPFDYLVNSRQKRLQLLAGIIDSDGHATVLGNRVNYEIVQKNKKLAFGIQKLATELGFSCSFAEKTATMRRKDGTMYKCVVYRLFLFGDLWQIPTKIKRKKFPRIYKHHKHRRNPLLCGFTVEPQPEQEYIGLVLDKDKLYLHSDCQVIHNTNPKKVADIYVRHDTNVKCVFRNHRKIGLIRKESTVEEMDEGGDECLKLWKDSDTHKLDKNGWTISKIHRHLISALDTDTSLEQYIDEDGKNWGAPCNKYGRVNREIANIKIQNDLDAVRHDLKKMSSRMRKSPRNQSEAFIKDQSKSIFNVMLLTTRLEHIRNTMKKPPYVRGNLYWIKEKGGPVGFKIDEHAGRFCWAWFPDEFVKGNKHPDQWKILNNFGKVMDYDVKGNYREITFPKNDLRFALGTDPIKYSKTKDPRASKASMHGFRKFDINVDLHRPKAQWETHNFIFEYIERPEDPTTYFDDVGMACHFLGCSVLSESNIKSLVQHFEREGWERFLRYPEDFDEMKVTKQDDAGFSSTPEVIDSYTRRLITFINEHCHRMPFDRTIESWLNFNPADTTTYDPTVSSGFTLVATEAKVDSEDEEPQELDDWFDMYDNSGNISRIVDIREGFPNQDVKVA